MFTFQVSAADTPEHRGGPPGSPMMFQRIDKNKDGKITADEIPDGAPDFVKEMLKRADKDGDKTVTAEEFRGSLPPFHGPAPDRPEARPPAERRARPRAGKAGVLTDRRRGERVVPRPVGRDLAWTPPGRPEAAGPGPRSPESRPDPKALFQRLDKDGDQKLSLDEFAEGMKMFHSPAAAGQRPPMMGRARWDLGPAWDNGR